MSISSSEINTLASQMNETTDLLTQAQIYDEVKSKTDHFNKLPEGCEIALETIQTLGLVAKTQLEAEMRQDIADSSQNEVPNENTLTKKTITFLSDNSEQIAKITIPPSLGILGAIYLGVPYPVKIGGITGLALFFGTKAVVGNCLKQQKEPLQADEESKQKAESLIEPERNIKREEKKDPKKIEGITNQTQSQITKKPYCSSVAALFSQLLDPNDRDKFSWMKRGAKLHDDTIKNLHLENANLVAIEYIIKANLSPSEIILDSNYLKINDDQQYSTNSDELSTLLKDLFSASSNEGPFGALITLSKETYAIYYNPDSHQFIFFNPYGSFHTVAEAHVFRSLNQLSEHLTTLKPLKDQQYPNLFEIRILRKNDTSSKEEVEEESSLQHSLEPNDPISATFDSSPSSEEEDSPLPSSQRSSLPNELIPEDAFYALSLEQPEESTNNLTIEELLQIALATNLNEDFIIYPEDNCLIEGNSVNKYIFMINMLSTPSMATEDLSDLKQLFSDGFGIDLTDEMFVQIIALREMDDVSKKFQIFKSTIKKDLEVGELSTNNPDRQKRFQEYVDDYFRKVSAN